MLVDTGLRARSRGVALDNINDGFNGKAPDLGAYERGGRSGVWLGSRPSAPLVPFRTVFIGRPNRIGARNVIATRGRSSCRRAVHRRGAARASFRLQTAVLCRVNGCDKRLTPGHFHWCRQQVEQQFGGMLRGRK